MSLKARAWALLAIPTLIWGLSYPISRVALDHLSPWAYTGLRFLFGALSLLPLALRQRRRPAPLAYTGKHSPRLWLWTGLLTGFLLSCGAVMQTYGLARLPSGQVGFLTAVYSSLVPVLALVIGFVPRLLVLVGMLVSFIGLFFLAGGVAVFGPAGGLVMAANFFWAAQIVTAGYFAAKVNTWLYILAQNLSAGLLVTGLAAIGGFLPTWEVFWQTLPFTMWGILSAGVAYVCQTQAQKSVSSTTVAVISPLQIVIAAAAGVVFLGEVMTGRMIWGASIIILGSLIAQLAREAVPLTADHPYYRLINRLRLVLAAASVGVVASLLVWSVTAYN